MWSTYECQRGNFKYHIILRLCSGLDVGPLGVVQSVVELLVLHFLCRFRIRKKLVFLLFRFLGGVGYFPLQVLFLSHLTLSPNMSHFPQFKCIRRPRCHLKSDGVFNKINTSDSFLVRRTHKAPLVGVCATCLSSGMSHSHLFIVQLLGICGIGSLPVVESI